MPAYFKKISFLIFFSVFFCVSPVSAEDDLFPKGFGLPQPSPTREEGGAKAPAGPSETEAAKEAKKDAGPAPAVTRDGEVSFFFDDADIYEVVQIVFGEVLRVNYLIDPGVKGRVNFRTVAPIPVSEVLSVMEVILRINGVGFINEKGIYRVVPSGRVANEMVYAQIGKRPEGAAMELFTFKNINIKDYMPDIGGSLGIPVRGGAVIPIYRLNAVVVVTSDDEEMGLARKWIESLDGMFADAKKKIYVRPLQNSKAGHIASILQAIFSGQETTRAQKPKAPEPDDAGSLFDVSTPFEKSAKTPLLRQDRKSQPADVKPVSVGGNGLLVSPETVIFADEITNSVIILATPADYAIVEETIKKLDVVPRQVLIEVLVAEATLGDELKFGIEWFIKSHFTSGNTELSGNIAFDSANVAAGLSGFTFTALDSANVVRGLLQTLASESKLRVLASPQIFASDNREARIQVGSQIPIVTSEISSQVQTDGSTGIQRNIQYKDTGVILKVVPQINEGGLVSLDITQEVSDVREAIASGVQSPVIFKRETTTNLVVQDGQTIVMGGLIQDRQNRVREGIPWLSRIPILGYLFGYTKDTEERTELVVLITPHVSRSVEDTSRVSSEYMNKLKGLKGIEGLK